jgi:hypothetical protein
VCQYCKRFGTTLVSYPWPTAPITFELLPVSPLDQEMLAILSLWRKRWPEQEALIVNMLRVPRELFSP